MLHILGPDTSNPVEDPETVMLQMFLDFIQKRKYTMDEFIKDCFADIDADETPQSVLVSDETMVKFKLVGLKTIITRYCSPKRMFKSEAFLMELQSMGIQVVYAARMDATLTAMRMDFVKAAAKESALDTSAVGSEEVDVVSDIFGRSDENDDLIEFKSIDENEEADDEDDEEDAEDEEEGEIV